MKHLILICSLITLPTVGNQTFAQNLTPIAPGAKIDRIATGFLFLEGPAADSDGGLYFSDIPNERIHRWTQGEGVTVVRENSGRANGLSLATNGTLFICEMAGRRVTALGQEGDLSVIAEYFQGNRFNSPNDLWLDPQGGVYFTDPRYGDSDDRELDGEDVFYISPDRQQLLKVIDDLVRPNGIVGTIDGTRVYVADHGVGRTYIYQRNEDGSLTDKRLFIEQGADGITLDELGNLYLTGSDITVVNPNGRPIGSIAIPETPSNLTFGGPNGNTLFITARTSLYALEMTVTGQ